MSHETKVPVFLAQIQSKIIAHDLKKKITIKAQLVTLLIEDTKPTAMALTQTQEGALHAPQFQHVGHKNHAAHTLPRQANHNKPELHSLVSINEQKI